MSKTVVNKVTKVVWDNGFKPDGVNIPSVTSADEGKVLAVDSNGKWVAASPSAPQSELPVYTAADEGKILKVDDQGDLEWAEDDNTQYTAGDNVSIVNGEISAVDTTYTAGANVQINDGVISATDTTYTAGTGISISAGNAISADSQLPTVTASDEGKVLKVDSNGDWAVGTDDDTKYTAGTNVSISNGVISATDTTYTAGTNVSITNGVISATDTTYTAGNGITITGTSIAADPQLPSVTSSDEGNVLTVDSQGNWVPDAVPKELPTVSSVDEGKILTVDSNGNWVKGANDAAAVKAAIADEYSTAMPFYPVYDSAITGTGNMLTDCFVGQKNAQSHIGGIRPFSTSRTDIYMAIYKDNSDRYKVALFSTSSSALFSGEVQVQWIAQDGTLQNPITVFLTTQYSGPVNSGYCTDNNSAQSIFGNGLFSEKDLIECAKDLSLCVYNSLSDAATAFGAWTIGGGASYAEGDQVWKDGKLQTYTNGAWVDSDPLVEQIANAGGGIMIPNPRNIIKPDTAMTSTNTYYSATQDCYFYCKLTGTSGTSASSGLTYMISLYPDGDSVHGSVVLAEGRYTINTGSPIVSHGFYLKAGYTIQVSRTISSGGTYAVYGLI